jgi:hypothetical protein
MPLFMTECYWPGVTEDTLHEAVDRARAAAAELTHLGTPVQLLGSWLVPADDVAYLLFKGTPAAVREANERASVPYERIVETIELSTRRSAHTPPKGSPR